MGTCALAPREVTLSRPCVNFGHQIWCPFRAPMGTRDLEVTLSRPNYRNKLGVFSHICKSTCTHTRMHAHAHACTRSHTHVHTHAYMHGRTYARTHAHTRAGALSPQQPAYRYSHMRAGTHTRASTHTCTCAGANTHEPTRTQPRTHMGMRTRMHPHRCIHSHAHFAHRRLPMHPYTYLY